MPGEPFYLSRLFLYHLCGLSVQRFPARFSAGLGPLSTKEYTYSVFITVEVGKDMAAEITPSNTYRVSVTLPQSLVNRLEVSQSGQALKIGLDAYFSSGERPRAIITLPHLYGVDLTGAGTGKVSGFKSMH